MRRLIYLSLVTAILGLVVHVLIILLIPSFALKDAWAKIGLESGDGYFKLVEPKNIKDALLPMTDPAFQIAACRYDLADQPMRISASGDLRFWSVAVFDRNGRNIYSLNDRTSVDGALSLIIVNAVQMAQIRKDAPEEISDAILVEAARPKGFVLIRALQEDESWSGDVAKFLKEAVCEKYELTNPQIEEAS